MSNDTLPTDQNVEREMVTIQCAQCYQSANLSLIRQSLHTQSANLEFRGLVTCDHEGHQWPVTISTDNLMQSTAQMMPVSESQNLSSNVPPALKADVKDAESTHFAQVYRASVVMCRRALQLGFQEPPHKISDGPYGRMLKKLFALPSAPLTVGTHGLAVGIGEYGGTGAHDPRPVTAEEARVTIFTTVLVLNELFPA